MHQQAQLRLKKDEVEKLGAEVYVVLAMDLHRTRMFKEENLLARAGAMARSPRRRAWSTPPHCRTRRDTRRRFTAWPGSACGGEPGWRINLTGS